MKIIGSISVILGIVGAGLAGYGQHVYNEVVRSIGSAELVNLALGLNPNIAMNASAYGASTGEMFAAYCLSNRNSMSITSSVLLIGGGVLIIMARKKRKKENAVDNHVVL